MHTAQLFLFDKADSPFIADEAAIYLKTPMKCDKKETSSVFICVVECEKMLC
jgi:hypothetical protein